MSRSGVGMYRPTNGNNYVNYVKCYYKLQLMNYYKEQEQCVQDLCYVTEFGSIVGAGKAVDNVFCGSLLYRPAVLNLLRLTDNLVNSVSVHGRPRPSGPGPYKFQCIQQNF